MSKWYKMAEYKCDCQECAYTGLEFINKIILQCNCSQDYYRLFIKHHNNPFTDDLGYLTDNGINALTKLLNYGSYEGKIVTHEDIEEIDKL